MIITRPGLRASFRFLCFCVYFFSVYPLTLTRVPLMGFRLKSLLFIPCILGVRKTLRYLLPLLLRQISWSPELQPRQRHMSKHRTVLIFDDVHFIRKLFRKTFQPVRKSLLTEADRKPVLTSKPLNRIFHFLSPPISHNSCTAPC